MRIDTTKTKNGFAFTNPIKKVEVAGFEPEEIMAIML